MSQRSVAYGDTPKKPPHYVSTHASAAGPELTAEQKVNSFMSTKNEGGDPVTALAYRGESSAESTVARAFKAGEAVGQATYILGSGR